MLALPAEAALWLLLTAGPISFYVAWSDMRAMRIPNGSVLLLAAGFLVIGLLVLPWQIYLAQLLHLPVVLVIGFVASSLRIVGAGDAKFAAAMAPYVARGDGLLFLYLFAAMLLGAFAGHRAARSIPALRNLAPDWESWSRRRDFPMGLALGGALAGYLVIAVLRGAPVPG